MRVSGLECFALALLLATQPAAAASRQASPTDKAKPSEKKSTATEPEQNDKPPKTEPPKDDDTKVESSKTEPTKGKATKAEESKDSAGASPTKGAESPKDESDDDDFDFDEPDEENAAPSEHQTKEKPGKGSQELPLGVATDAEGAPLVAVHFRGEPGTHYYVGPPRAQNDAFGNLGRVRLDADELRELCQSPCARWLYPGSYSFALSRNGDPVRTPELLSIDEPVELEGQYHSNTLVRTLGYVAMGVGVVGGSLLIASSLSDCGSTDGTCLQRSANVFIGAGVMLAGLTGGLILTQVKDKAEVSAKPASPGLGEPK